MIILMGHLGRFTSTPYLVLFVILGAIGVTAAYAGDLSHTRIAGNLWVDNDIKVMENAEIIGDLDAIGEIREQGNPVTTVLQGSDDPNIVDPGGSVGDLYLRDTDNDGTADNAYIKGPDGKWNYFIATKNLFRDNS